MQQRLDHIYTNNLFRKNHKKGNIWHKPWRFHTNHSNNTEVTIRSLEWEFRLLVYADERLVIVKIHALHPTHGSLQSFTNFTMRTFSRPEICKAIAVGPSARLRENFPYRWNASSTNANDRQTKGFHGFYPWLFLCTSRSNARPNCKGITRRW